MYNLRFVDQNKFGNNVINQTLLLRESIYVQDEFSKLHKT